MSVNDEIESLFEPFCGDSAAILLSHLSTLPASSNEIPEQIRTICGDSKQTTTLIKQYLAHRHTLSKRHLPTASKSTLQASQTTSKINAIHLATRIGGTEGSCECQAQFHDLKTSCSDCGRVICVVEALPCWFCARNPRINAKSDSSQDRPKAKVDAEALRQRLQQYAREDTLRTKVTDIAGDFAHSNWDSRELQALKAEKKKEVDAAMDQKRGYIVNIDLKKGMIVEEGKEVRKEKLERERMAAIEIVEDAEKKAKETSQGERKLRNPDLKYEAPLYVEREDDGNIGKARKRRSNVSV